MPTTDLQYELSSRAEHGQLPITVKEMSRRLASIGYKLDRKYDCLSNNRWVETGKSYPAINAHVVEADTGRPFASIEARRDDNYRALRRMRFDEEVFCVVRGRILEI